LNSTIGFFHPFNHAIDPPRDACDILGAMAKIMQKVKHALTPSVHHTVASHGAMLTILWISLTFLSMGFMWALIVLYDRILLLEDAIRILAA
jgi:hypothetical protein